MTSLNAALLSRLSALPAPDTAGAPPTDAHRATVIDNLNSLGVEPSSELVESIKAASAEGLRDFNRMAIAAINEAFAGSASALMKPLYEDFPNTRMPDDEATLFLSRLASGQRTQEPSESSKPDQRKVGLLVREAVEDLFGQMLSQPASYSAADRELLAALWVNLPTAEAILGDVEVIPNKENLAHLHVITGGSGSVTRRLETATDVLRVVVANAGVSPDLSDRTTKLANLKRSVRRDLLGALDQVQNPLEDMARHVTWWKRVGEKLHPGEYAKRFPNAATAFRKLRAGDLPQSFDGKVNAALHGPLDELLSLLKARPGVFNRRLDEVLRNRPADADAILHAYNAVGSEVATPALLQAHAHFKSRNNDRTSRVYFPKGSTARPWVKEGTRPHLAGDITEGARYQIERSLLEKFAKLPALGKVWMDPAARGLKTPLQVRDASESLRTMARGSRVPLPDNMTTARGFMWWMDSPETGRVDLDLSAAALDEDLQRVGYVAYYNLECSRTGMRHSGDFTQAPAPDGAAEFVDIPFEAAKKAGARYVIVTVHSFTLQSMAHLQGAFAGVQEVGRSTRKEVFNIDQVVNRFQLNTDTMVFTPLAIDLHTREMIWLDMPSRPRISGPVNLDNTSHSISAPLDAMLNSDAPALQDLIDLHVQARGEWVENREDADFVIADDGDLSPYNTASILTDWAA